MRLSQASPPDPPARWSRRVAWLLALWTASVAALALVAWLLNAAMNWAGLVR
jgi:hypothetical protein